MGYLFVEYMRVVGHLAGVVQFFILEDRLHDKNRRRLLGRCYHWTFTWSRDHTYTSILLYLYPIELGLPERSYQSTSHQINTQVHYSPTCLTFYDMLCITILQRI